MLALTITQAEIQSEQINSEHLEAATKALREDGVVVLKDVIDRAHIELLRGRMLEDVRTILQRTNVPTQFTAGNIQQDPPPFPPYLFRDVLTNPVVIAVTKSILGARLKNGAYTGNANLPGSLSQPVHVDSGQLWPNLEVAHPAYSLVVNVPVVDMDVSNGSTEIWPGTHMDTTMFFQQDTLRIPEARINQRRAVAPPYQPAVQVGSVLIRDMRLWHRGMPNNSNNPRPMIAMIHYSSWWHTGTMRFPKGTEGIFQSPDLISPIEFVDGSIDYLMRHSAYDIQT